MSSTGRSNVRKQHKYDYYRTPVQPIVDFLEAFNYNHELDPAAIIFDPAAGGDENNEMPYRKAIIDYYMRQGFWLPKIKTLDIRGDSRADFCEDYLTYKLNFRPQVIITNPPFSLTQQFIEKAINDVADNGYVIMLLRLNYFESEKRFKFYQNYMPIEAYVHHKRLSFTDDGKTDSCAYMHCVWQKGNYPKYCKLRVI